MISMGNGIERNVEATDKGVYFEDIAVRYSIIEGKLITAKTKTEFLDKVFKVVAQLTGVTVNMVKEQHYDDIKYCWTGSGQYHVIFKFYDFGQELVIDINKIDKVTKARGERHENY